MRIVPRDYSLNWTGLISLKSLKHGYYKLPVTESLFIITLIFPESCLAVKIKTMNANLVNFRVFRY